MANDPAPDPTAPARRPDTPALYTARVRNVAGTAGHVEIRDAAAVELAAPGPEANGEVSLPTGGPTPTATGFNPEQFLAMAWSTCLGETLRVVLTEHGLDRESSVSVEVGMHRDPAGGFRFLPRALVSIEHLDPGRAQEMAEAAHARCPVSKLLRGQGEPTLDLMVEE